MFCKKGVLIKFTGKHLCQSLFLIKFQAKGLKACNFIKKEALAQVFSSEFYQICKNTFLHRTPLVAASKRVTQNINPIQIRKFLYTDITIHLKKTMFVFYSGLLNSIYFVFICSTNMNN